MIDDKKLLCAFVYGAYASGLCGVRKDFLERTNSLEAYERYVHNGENFPESQFGVLRSELTTAFNSGNLRNYIYKGHFNIVKRDIEKASGKSFEQALKSDIFLALALNCPVSFYVVDRQDGSEMESEITVQELFSNRKRKLIRLEGLGDVYYGEHLSAHWNHMLEVVDWDGLEKYENLARDWYDTLKKIVGKR